MPKIATVLAFIKQDGFEEVLLDIIEVSKKGSAYHYKDKVWNRDYLHKLTALCFDAKGNSIQIQPLNRHYNPSWVDMDKLVISPMAKERYEVWISRYL